MKSLKIVLLFDTLIHIPPEEFVNYWDDPDWKSERDVRNTLMKLGHNVIPFGLFDDIEPFVKFIKNEQPDLVFNMSEAFNGDRDQEPNITALMELLGVPFTGAGAMSLRVCKDKGLTKSILSYHDISTPKFMVAKKGSASPSLKNFPFPAFIKPLQLESSEGITQSSYCEDEESAFARVKFIHDKLGVDAIIEEFIDGREVYVSILGNDKLTVFPPREMFFKQIPNDEPKFATFKSKWDQEYRKKWGIDSGWMAALPELTEKKLTETCKKIYKLLNISGFGRIDLRIRNNEEIYFLEANPNPSISKKEDYSLSASKGGMDYEELISKIVTLSLSKEKDKATKSNVKTA